MAELSPPTCSQPAALRHNRKGEIDVHPGITQGRKEHSKRKFTGGGGKNSELEVALAKKVVSLSETLATVNNERNEMFETLYSIGTKLGKGAIAQKLAAKRKADLMSQSKAHYKAMLEAGRKAEAIDTEAKDEIGTAGEKDAQ